MSENGFEQKSLLETDVGLVARILRLLNKFNTYMLLLTSVCMFSTMCVEVFIRYILKGDLVAMEEYLFFIAVWTIFLGSANGSYERSHVSADTISVVFKNPTVLKAGEFIRQNLTMLLSLAFAYYGFTFLQGSLALKTYTTIYRLPFLIGHSAVFYGTLFMAVYQLYHYFEYISSFIGKGKTAETQTGNDVG